MESEDRFEIFKIVCRFMDEGNWWEAMKIFKKLTSFCWEKFLMTRGMK